MAMGLGMRIGFCSSAVGLLSGCFGDANAEPSVLLADCDVVVWPSMSTRSCGFAAAGVVAGVTSIFLFGVVWFWFFGSFECGIAVSIFANIQRITQGIRILNQYL